MKIKVVHFSDLHFGSGERYGSINPQTGLNKRFEDFMCAVDKTINFATENNVDLVLFTGDTYKHACPEPIYQKEFAIRIKKLSSHIPTVLLVGNHDVLYRVDGSSSLDIYNALDIDNVTVFNKIELQTLTTKNGQVQIISLPHITKSKLLTKEEYRSISPSEQDSLMISKVRDSIKGFIEKLNPNIPSILIGHGTIENAQFGSEQELSIGKVLSYPLSFFQREELDYVGFGHIHKHQILQEKDPLILYAGSLERVDFGEEKEEKGFVYFELERKNISNFKFIPSGARTFLTIECDLTDKLDPQEFLAKEIKKYNLKDLIVRIKYKILDENLDKINSLKIKELLSSAFSFAIQPEIERKERTYRMENMDSSIVTDPIFALEKYLFDFPNEEKEILMKTAKELIEEIKEENVST